MSNDILNSLERRLGRLHARHRISIEDDDEARVFGRGLNYFHPENWYPTIIGNALKLTGLYWRGKKKAEPISGCPHRTIFPRRPPSFAGCPPLQSSRLPLVREQEPC